MQRSQRSRVFELRRSKRDNYKEIEERADLASFARSWSGIEFIERSYEPKRLTASFGAPNARSRTEVKEQPDLQVCAPEIAEDLSQRALRQRDAGLDLNDDDAEDDHVEALSRDLPTLIQNGDRKLAPNTMSSCAKFLLQGCGVYILEESVPK